MVLYLAKFMASSKLAIQRESVGCLCELSQVNFIIFETNHDYFNIQDDVNKRLLADTEMGGYTIAEWLANLLNSPVEAIAAYAACALFAIDNYNKVRITTLLSIK